MKAETKTVMNAMDEDVSKLLRAFRRQAGIKQVAVAEWLDISQAYYSRIESGTKQPSIRLRKRISRLLKDRRFQSTFERWRLVVKNSPTCASLIREGESGIELIDYSNGFRVLGGNFSLVSPGAQIDGLLGGDVDKHLTLLRGCGAFRGDIQVAENIWYSHTANGKRHYHAITTAVPDELGGVSLHSNHRRITEQEYEAAIEAGRMFRIVQK